MPVQMHRQGFPIKQSLLMLRALLITGMLAGSASLSAAQPSASSPGAAAFQPARLMWEMGLVFFLILVNALFAMAEYALITVRRTRIRQLAEEGNQSALLVQQMTERSNSARMMATIQTGITLIATLSSGLAATSAVTPLASWLKSSLPSLAPFTPIIALLSITLPVAILSLVIGEIAPKSLGVQYADRLSLIAIHPLIWMQKVLSPFVSILTFLSNLTLKPFGGAASFTTPSFNEEEIKILVEAGEEQGVLEAGETRMIQSVLDFGDTVTRKVMTPRIDISAFEINDSLTNLIALVSASGHSRIPVYVGDLDNIIGIVHAKDLLGLPMDASPNDIRQVMRHVYYIPESKKVDALLTEFRRSRQQIAIVRDEYGVTAGLVTIEDVIEEIVGEIQDEYDAGEPVLEHLDEYTVLADGRYNLGDLNQRLNLNLPEEESDSIGGFVFALLGRQAEQGEETQFENTGFVVEETDGRRITRVRILLPQTKLAESEEQNQESSLH